MTMGLTSTFREQMAKIRQMVNTPDSTPRAIMTANKVNTALEWDEEADAVGFDTHVEQSVESYERAVDAIVGHGTKK